MRLSSLCVAAVLLFSSAAFAQHSSGASSSSSASNSSSGGGGSHSSSSGGSSSSGSSAGSHSSGGSVSSTSSAHGSGGAVSHVSSARSSSSASVSSHPVVHDPRSNAVPAIREPNAGARGKTEPSEKKGFFSFLRHPFRKPSPKPEPTTKVVSNLRRWICVNGPCAICPPGQSRVGGQCTGTVSANQTPTFCRAGEFSSGGACLLQTRFMDSCSGQRRVMEQQARRMQAAGSAQQSACASGSMQDCSNLTGTAQSEADLYRTLQDRYQTCLQRSQAAYPFTRFGFSAYSSGLLFDPLEFDVNYR
jgi:hypothetical protein